MYVTTMGVVNKKLTILKEECFADYKTGSVNVDRIVFNFSGTEWDGLTKIAVFVTKDGQIKDVPLIGNYCDVPIDIYLDNTIDPRNTNYSFDISIGVYGQLIDDQAGTITKILPTNLVNKKVSLGSYFPGQEPSGLPTAEEWQLYIDEVGRLATEAKNEADRAAEIKVDIEAIQRELNELAVEMRTLENNAKSYANNAHSYMESAESFANNSSNYANSSSNFANNSALSANEANHSAGIASNYANSAHEASNMASNYANNSSGWANAAHNYANNASNFANSAKTYMQNASYSANLAESYAQNSSNFANISNGAALNATNAANNARNFANNASNYANNSYGWSNMASNYANNSANWANAASNYSNTSKEYRDATQEIKDDVVEIYDEIYDISASRMFAAFNVNAMNGDLIMTTVQSLGNIGFALDSNGNLVVELT